MCVATFNKIWQYNVICLKIFVKMRTLTALGIGISFADTVKQT